MSRRLVEREALFYLIDIGASHAVVVNPLSRTAQSLGGMQHTDLRFDGAYLQRSPSTGAFVGYYIFSSSEEVRYRSINNLNANGLVYSRPSRYTRLNHPWLVMHWSNNAQPCKMVASIQSYGIQVEWRYPPRPEHLKPLALPFYASMEPMVGALFSDEIQQRSSTLCHIRLFFVDRERVQVSVVEKGKKKPVQKDAVYMCEMNRGMCYVKVRAPWFEMRLLSFGGLLIELSLSGPNSGSTPTRFSFACRAVRVFAVVGTSPDDTAAGPDEIDIYEFLRTYRPGDRDAAATDDSSEVDDEPQSMDEPYIMARNGTATGTGFEAEVERIDL